MRCSIRVLLAWLALAVTFSAVPAAGPPTDSEAEPHRLPRIGDDPRQLFDTVIAATVNRDMPAAARAKARLVLEYPESLYGRYVVTTFAQPQEYRKLLQDQLKEHQKDLGPGFAKQFCQAVRLGSAWFGPPFMVDDVFALQCALAGYEGSDYHLAVSCRDKIGQSKNDALRRIAVIAFDGTLSDAEKVSRLHDIEDPPAPQFKEFFASRLSPADRETTEMLRVAAETLLEDRKLTDARPLVETLANRERTAQFQCWRVWCLAALGTTQEAKAAIQSLEQGAPHDDWTACAREIGKTLDAQEAHMTAMADLLVDALARIRRTDTDAVEGTATYRTKDGRVITVYVAALFRRGVIETVVQENGRVVVAYKAAQGQGRIYFDGESTIQAFSQNATYPVFSCDLNATPQTMTQNWNVNLAPSAEAMSQIHERLKISPNLLTRDGMIAVLRGNLVGAGVFPAELVRDGQGTWLTLLHPQARKPMPERSQLHFAADGALTHVEMGRFTFENLRYGRSDTITLSPPRWPDLPVVTRDEMDPASFFRLFGAAYSLFASKPTSTAARPASIR